MLPRKKRCATCREVFFPYADEPLCTSCYTKEKARKAALEEAELENAIEPAPPRKCHDCGRKTVNYRCDECWEKKRGSEYLSEARIEGSDYGTLEGDF